MNDDEKQWELPEPFDAAKRPELLALNDEEQAARRERFGKARIFPASPRQRIREIAYFEIEAIRNRADHAEITADEVRTLASHYATLGEYEVAKDLDPGNAELYQKYLDALNLPDDEWCVHPDRHKYIKEYIWDAENNVEATLLACNVCGIWNVADPPEKLIAASRRRSEVRTATKGMTLLESRAFLLNNYRHNDV